MVWAGRCSMSRSCAGLAAPSLRDSASSASNRVAVIPCAANTGLSSCSSQELVLKMVRTASVAR